MPKQRKIHRWWSNFYGRPLQCYTLCNLGGIHQGFTTKVDKDVTCGNCLRIMATPWWDRAGKAEAEAE